MLTEEEYPIVKERARKGKVFLTGKWSSKDPQVMKWRDLWFDMSSQILEYEIAHGYFKPLEEKSIAMKMLEEREAQDNARRAKARDRYRTKREETK